MIDISEQNILQQSDPSPKYKQSMKLSSYNIMFSLQHSTSSAGGMKTPNWRLNVVQIKNKLRRQQTDKLELKNALIFSSLMAILRVNEIQQQWNTKVKRYSLIHTYASTRWYV